MRSGACWIVVLLALTVCPDAIRAQDAGPRLVWKISVGQPIVALEWSSNGNCVAAATGTTVYVIDADGTRLWDWNYRRTNRFIRITPYPPFALSPVCDAVVLRGDPSYRYVLSADRNGGRHLLKTAGTPLSVRFDPTGQTVAVVTGASRGYVLSPALDVRWSGATASLPVRWAGQTGDTRSEGGTIFSRRDVDALFGARLWTWGQGDVVSGDGQWRAVFGSYTRGGEGSVELWGPDAGGYRGRQDRRGEPRWVKPMGCLNEGTLSSDGQFVAVIGDPKNPDAGSAHGPQCDGVFSTYVFDRAGQLVLTWPAERDLSELPAAIQAQTGRPFLGSMPGSSASEPVWSASVPGEQAWPRYSPDRSRQLVAAGSELRLYRAPE